MATNFERSGVFHDWTNLAWFALVASTLIGWWLGYIVQNGHGDVRPATVGVLVTAFVKTWIVGFQFMELKSAPGWLRHTFDAWVIVVCVVLIVLRVGG